MWAETSFNPKIDSKPEETFLLSNMKTLNGKSVFWTWMKNWIHEIIKKFWSLEVSAEIGKNLWTRKKYEYKTIIMCASFELQSIISLRDEDIWT